MERVDPFSQPDNCGDIVEQVFEELTETGKIKHVPFKGEYLIIKREEFDDMRERYLSQERGYGWGV